MKQTQLLLPNPGEHIVTDPQAHIAYLESYAAGSRLGEMLTTQVFESGHQEELAEMRRIAETDPITHLPNRLGLIRAYEEITSGEPLQDRSDQDHVLFLDLDGFKGVNDAEGHNFGNIVLNGLGALAKDQISRVQAGANYLQSAARRSTDTIGRDGGDEYVAFLRGTDKAGALVVANRIRESFNSVTAINGTDVTGRLGVSIGIGLIDPSLDYPTMVGRAEEAMRVAKRQGKNTQIYFEEGFEAATAVNPTVTETLRRAASGLDSQTEG